MKLLSLLALSTLLIVLAPISSGYYQNIGDNTLAVETSLTVSTDSNQYILREKVNVNGTATIDGFPATDILVSLQVQDPASKNLLYRTLPIGNPNETWVLEVQGISIFDLDWNPIDTVRVGSTVFFGAKVYNPMYITRDPVTITMTIIGGNNMSIAGIKLYEGSIGGMNYVAVNRTVYIPTWITPGEAFIYVNVYDRLPSEGGVPYLPEHYAKFYISLSNQGAFGPLPLKIIKNNSSQSAGSYQTSFRLSPAPQPGDYNIFSAARYNQTLKSYSSTSFAVLDAESPPQASFTYTPLNPYPNQTVLFDASASTAEGYGDVIIKYEWDFGDGTPKLVKAGNATHPPEPTATHNFMSQGQFIVTLNVTDTEGYWSTTQKPIYVKSPNPIAEFTWDPLTPRINVTITFNATSSLPGWSIPKGTTAPIVLYMWNFGDSSINFNTTSPTIQHSYTYSENFTVTLTVFDSENQQDTITHIVSVANSTSPPYDINGDGVVNIRDVAIVAAAFGTYPGDPRWDPRADITGPTGEPDGKVDIRDVSLVAAHFGEYV